MRQISKPVDEDHGPWQSGWYVVASKRTQMPSRCMVCGEEIATLVTTPVPMPKLSTSVVSATLWLVAGERFGVRHGRCARHRVPWSKYLGVLTGLVCIGSMLGFVGSMLAKNGRFGPVEGVLVGAFAVSIVSMIVLALMNLRIEKADGVHIWIGGFGRGFRERLPLFHKTRA